MPLEIDASGDAFTLIVKEPDGKTVLVYTLRDSTLEPFNTMRALQYYLKNKREK